MLLDHESNSSLDPIILNMNVSVYYYALAAVNRYMRQLNIDLILVNFLVLHEVTNEHYIKYITRYT